MGERLSRLMASRFAWVAVAVISIGYLLIHPIGFTGGGSDDSRYLEAARCWAASGGMCLPDNHWATRWPAVAPIAAGIRLFGEGRNSIGIGTLAGWIASIVLVGLIGRMWFDRTAGLLAAALFASIPRISAWATQPGADLIELSFQLAALALATLAYRRQRVALAIAAGVSAALAVQTRETSLAFCMVAGVAWLLLARDHRRVLLWAVAGFAGAMAIEMAAYAFATGDPLARFRLSLGHVGIPSPELDPSVDTSRSPLFNPAYIAGWRRSMGIHWWWPIDPWINLFASPAIGLWLLAGAGMGLAFRSSATPDERRAMGRIAIGAALVAALLVYGLAVDPKARMFFLPAAAASLIIAVAAMEFIRRGQRLLPTVVLVLLFAWGVGYSSRLNDMRGIEQAARAWIAAHPGQVESDNRTIGALTLLPEVRLLPPVGSGRPLRLVLATTPCAILAAGKANVIAEQRSGAGYLCLVSPTRS